jgi:peroxiredoxin
MKKNALFLLVVLCLSGFLSLSFAQTADKPTDAPKDARLEKMFPLAPEFTLEDIYQDEHSLKSYRDKQQPVLLFFWTTWCPYCQQELKVLNNMSAVLAQDKVVILAINVGENPLTVENFVKSYYLSYKILLDKDTYVSRSFDIVGVPTYVLIDKGGHIVYKNNYFPLREYKDLVAG